MPGGVFIPGVSGRFNATESIEKIMETKRQRLTQMESERELMNQQRTAWTEINTKAVSVRDTAGDLFGIRAPFEEKISLSSDEYSFSGTATRAAQIGEYRINIIQKAQAHRVASENLERNYRMPAGVYRIKAGEEEIPITFNGGDLQSFAEIVNRNSRNRLKASVTNVSSSISVLVIESGKSGVNGGLSFGDDFTKNIFKQMNFFEEVSSTQRNIEINSSTVTANSRVQLNNNSVVLEPATNTTVMINQDIPMSGRLRLEFNIKKEDLSETNSNNNQVFPEGPNFRDQAGLEIGDTRIDGEQIRVDIPGFVRSEPPRVERIDNNSVIEIVTASRTITIPELEITGTLNKLTINLEDYLQPGEIIKSINLNNKNTHKRITVADMRVYDEADRNGLRFIHELATPANAILTLDGIQVERESNSIDDLIRGVTLNVFDSTDKEETLKVDRDYTLIVEKITGFLGEYNQFVEMLRNKVSTNPDQNNERGIFAGDQTLNSLMSRMRSIFMNPYSTNYGQELSMLSQVGISTNASGNFGLDMERIQRGGIIEVNEDKFIDMMQAYPDGIKQLFGNDTTGDNIINDGVAYQINSLLRAYTLRGNGIFDTRVATVDSRIENQNRRISSYQEQLADEERELRRDFNRMEQAAQQLDDSSKQFQNMYPQQ